MSQSRPKRQQWAMGDELGEPFEGTLPGRTRLSEHPREGLGVTRGGRVGPVN